MFQLTFLGTSSGVPTKHRNVSGLGIECVNPYLSGDKKNSRKNRPWVLIDCGEGTQHQLLHTKLSVSDLAIICITHMHGDHCYGLPGLLASMGMNRRAEPLTLIAPKAIGKFLDTVSLTTELHFPFAIEFLAIEDLLQASGAYQQQFSPTQCLDIHITALSHRVDSYAFALTQTLTHRKLNVKKLKQMGVPAGENWGKLQRGDDVTLDDGQRLKSADFVYTEQATNKIVVAGDNDTPSLLTDAIKDATVLVHEATYTQSVLDKIMSRETGFNPQHTTAKQIAQFAHHAGLPNLILTHFSARYQPFDDANLDNNEANDANDSDAKQNHRNTPSMTDIRQEVQQYYHGNLWLAEDFMSLSVGSNMGCQQTN